MSKGIEYVVNNVMVEFHSLKHAMERLSKYVNIRTQI